MFSLQNYSGASIFILMVSVCLFLFLFPLVLGTKPRASPTLGPLIFPKDYASLFNILVQKEDWPCPPRQPSPASAHPPSKWLSSSLGLPSATPNSSLLAFPVLYGLAMAAMTREQCLEKGRTLSCMTIRNLCSTLLSPPSST